MGLSTKVVKSDLFVQGPVYIVQQWSK
uniref:Uncharacterized protein n=1 Tax=Arundo donax TaxID=35708 RepID=A0A0A9BB33_ARUDO